MYVMFERGLRSMRVTAGVLASSALPTMPYMHTLAVLYARRRRMYPVFPYMCIPYMLAGKYVFACIRDDRQE